MLDPDSVYSPHFPQALSLECAEGDDSQPCLEFTLDTVCKLNNLNKLRTGKFQRVALIPLYHDHVLWSFCLSVERIGSGLTSCKLRLTSCGPHLSFADDLRSAKRNAPRGQEEPNVLRATLTTLREDGEEGVTMDFKIDDKKIISVMTYTHRELYDLAVNGRLEARLRITVPRAYFVLAELVDITDQCNATGAHEFSPQRILAGESPPGADWFLTTPEDDMHPAEHFRVHRQRLAEMSPPFKEALATGHDVKGVIEMVPGEERSILTKFGPGELQQVVALLYECPLPHPLYWRRINELCAAMRGLFAKSFDLEHTYREWERNICSVSLRAKDSADLKNAFTYLLMAANLIWSIPVGSTPVAKRVVIGAMADLLHRNAYAHESPARFMKEMFSFCTKNVTDSPHLNTITSSVYKHLLTVSQVRKRGVAVPSISDIMPMELFAETMGEIGKAMLEFTPVITKYHSLESAAGIRSGDRLQFARDFEFSYSGDLEDMKVDRAGAETESIPHYHDGVLWSVMLRSWKDSEDEVRFCLTNTRSHVNEKKENFGLNAPPALKLPRVLEASLTFLDKKKKEIETVDFDAHLILTRALRMSELRAFAVGDAVRIRLSVTYARAFFRLPRIIDLDAKPSVPEGAEDTVAAILRGERPDDAADCTITVVEKKKLLKGQCYGGLSTFHVHRAVLAEKSAAFKSVFASSRPFEDLIVSTGDGGYKLHEDIDIRVLLALVYGTPVPLPGTRYRASTLVDALQKLFKADLLSAQLYPSWERAICVAARAVDKSTLSSLSAITRLLALIWSCPYGAMPVAKRVTVAAAADLLHLNTDGNVGGLFKAIVNGADDRLREHVSIVKSVLTFLREVSRVRKTLVSGEQKLREDEELWYEEEDEEEAESGFFSSVCNCVIS